LDWYHVIAKLSVAMRLQAALKKYCSWKHSYSIPYCLGSGGASRPLPRDGARRNSVETQESGYASRYGPEIKIRSSAKDSAPERLGCETIQK